MEAEGNQFKLHFTKYVSWLDLVLSRFVPVYLARCYSASFLHEKYNSLSSGMWWIWSILEMFAFGWSHNTLRFKEKRRRTGGIHDTYGRVKESILNDYYSFQDFFGKFSHSKAIHFLVLSLYINAARVVKD